MPSWSVHHTIHTKTKAEEKKRCSDLPRLVGWLSRLPPGSRFVALTYIARREQGQGTGGGMLQIQQDRGRTEVWQRAWGHRRHSSSLALKGLKMKRGANTLSVRRESAFPVHVRPERLLSPPTTARPVHSSVCFRLCEYQVYYSRFPRFRKKKKKKEDILLKVHWQHHQQQNCPFSLSTFGL